MFVQIQQKWRRMYAGECKGPGVRTDFEIVHLRRAPVQYNHLSGLLDIFKSKIGCSLFPLPPVNIAIRFTYVLQDWQQYSWPQQPPGEAVTELFKLCCRTECTEEIPGRGYAEDEGKENSDISSALSKLTEPAATVPISKLSVSNMVHSARKHIRRHRRIDESPLNTEILNSVLLLIL
uniref:rab3 GTPase-activating protein catalytic subunit-like isoform X2 n=1 Tax=Maylandia zebra TaxID=106582 RepID=UPI000D30B0E5|nr:rab3 GTPase-activating protein catalytic subunit-like isoform X2 [Maylandia zebra]